MIKFALENKNKILSIVKKITKSNLDELEDAFQETLLRILKYSPKVDNELQYLIYAVKNNFLRLKHKDLNKTFVDVKEIDTLSNASFQEESVSWQKKAFDELFTTLTNGEKNAIKYYLEHGQFKSTMENYETTKHLYFLARKKLEKNAKKYT